ncbi:hypothetical protein K1T71_001280 [Dendrolimus kikuchii]|uniref:Uncharacterized protein n=1 Tax=Dendrolimus kikuchii TaxID=765133 RepID=A0ACC1DH65_9NEOP|nr:hypothetical protein K1T71_001280 [Dendrolimus kikuchii]
MYTLLLPAICRGSQVAEPETCDTDQLKICVQVPRTPVGLPRNKEELDAHCRAYHIGMSCMEAWIQRCLPTDGQKILQQQIGGARALMRFLCSNGTSLRKDFLKEQVCWSRVSPEWLQCVKELQEAAREIVDRSQPFTYFKRNSELCCARDDFLRCVAYAGRLCSSSASNLLKRMAWVLAQDVASCSQQQNVYCSAPSPHIAAPFLTTIGVMLYPLRL